MKRVLSAGVLLVFFCCSALAGGYFMNDTDETVYGLRVEFSDPVTITSFGDTLTTVEPLGESTTFTFSGGAVESWGEHWIVWEPASASILRSEWLTEVTAVLPKPSTTDLGDDFICGAFAGGAWGLTNSQSYLLPEDNVSFLKSLNVRWVGLSISLTIDDSMDPAVRQLTEADRYPTFDEEELRALICRLRQEGFRVYMTLAFSDLDDFENEPARKGVKRYQLGDPYIYEEDSAVDPARWPWDPAHPDHNAYVSEFFRTYTEWAVYYAQIAEEEGVELYSLGTETDRLFRTRSLGSRWPTNYRNELTAMVQQVREVYSGPLTYDMLYSSHLRDEKDNESIWGDLGLDAIGVSAYFRLLDRQVVSQIPSVEELQRSWEEIFTETLMPLRNRYPQKPILFLEYGYIDLPGAASSPAEEEFVPRMWIDADGDGLDDGEEEQAAIHEALFQTVDRHSGVLNGVFLWGHLIATDASWRESSGLTRNTSVRDKLSADVVSEWYGKWAPSPNYSEEEICWARPARAGEVLGGLAWDDLPTLLVWDASSPFRYWSLDLEVSRSTAMDAPHERLDESALQIRSLSGAILGKGIAVRLGYESGSGPTDNPRIEFVLTIGVQRDLIFASIGNAAAEFAGGPCGNQEEIPIPWEFMDIGADYIGIAVPFDLVGSEQCVLRNQENRTIELTVAFRGQSEHAFIAYPGLGALDILESP